jgi:RNA polymerase sigma factor (sigma-70 family)
MPSKKTDERLVRDCLKGDENAWSELIDRYKNLIYSIPVKRGFSPQDANDIFQSVCVELLSELGRLRDPQALPKWLMQTTLHKCFHWLRKEQRYTSTDDEAGFDPASPAPIPEELLVELQQEQALRRAIADIPPRCSQLIQMLFFATPARSYQEIAAELGLAIGSIGFVRGRCLDQLKKRLMQQGFK